MCQLPLGMQTPRGCHCFVRLCTAKANLAVGKDGAIKALDHVSDCLFGGNVIDLGLCDYGVRQC